MFLALNNVINMILTFDFVLFSSASVMTDTSTDSSDAWFPGRTKKSMSHHHL